MKTAELGAKKLRKPRSDRALSDDEARMALHLLDSGDANTRDLARYFGLNASLFSCLHRGRYKYQEIHRDKFR